MESKSLWCKIYNKISVIGLDYTRLPLIFYFTYLDITILTYLNNKYQCKIVNRLLIIRQNL